ncbi:MAG: bifunctional diaminohydroxyphosphoribosylaminopyrimidine deaminase/5-amino-6-(5-phosphoribosylamino)uracil reductase RibD [Pseudomonadota bacterium]|nr:bifunctional diaminohydroxyphosphoribosylaminopyrimidine deaminase/5-amino-6-(5-phosphoribosylamino)uracil reductase RibD [Pseudomonadota bacterium]
MLSESILNEAMHSACAEARKWLGATSPNPAVGAAALDADGQLLAVTAHQKAGELHAEVSLIAQARARGILQNIHTLCLTLEPCNHQGRTPPCTRAIIEAGIKHVAVGTRDPNPHVKGGGLEFLRQAGIEVASGINGDECQQLIHAFAFAIRTNKPWVTLKRAFDFTNSMVPPSGRKVFTSPGSLRFAHRLRKRSDAILTGSGTILADNPLFTVREIADYAGKRRFLAILDRRRRVSDHYVQVARQRGLDVLIYQDVEMAFSDLARRGARDVLVEAGVTLSQAILDRDLWSVNVDIYRQEPHDRIETRFNARTAIPFDVKSFRWEHVLPE